MVAEKDRTGKGLAWNPNCLMLDEPTAGMNLEEKEDIVRFVLDTHELRKILIILIEHEHEPWS